MPPDKRPSTLHARLERAFRDAKVPGSLVTPLTISPETAVQLAAKHFAEFLRDEAASMRRTAGAFGPSSLDVLANEIDPLGPVMAAPAAGGIS